MFEIFNQGHSVRVTRRCRVFNYFNKLERGTFFRLFSSINDLEFVAQIKYSVPFQRDNEQGQEPKDTNYTFRQ